MENKAVAVWTKEEEIRGVATEEERASKGEKDLTDVLRKLMEDRFHTIWTEGCWIYVKCGCEYCAFVYRQINSRITLFSCWTNSDFWEQKADFDQSWSTSWAGNLAHKIVIYWNSTNIHFTTITFMSWSLNVSIKRHQTFRKMSETSITTVRENETL